MFQVICLLSCAAIWCYIGLVSADRLVLEWYTLIEISIWFLIAGFLDAVWNNRKRIVSKAILLVFLGYTTWVIITNTKLEYSKGLALGECAIMLISLFIAVLLLHRGGHNA